MIPTFQNHQEIAVAKVKTITRFTVVVFDPPNGDSQKYLKRVIGLPGEHVAYRNGELLIDDHVVKDSFSDETQDFRLEELTGVSVVPNEMYFVLGDNRKNSLDSRSFGFVSANKITGTVSGEEQKMKRRP